MSIRESLISFEIDRLLLTVSMILLDEVVLNTEENKYIELNLSLELVENELTNEKMSHKEKKMDEDDDVSLLEDIQVYIHIDDSEMNFERLIKMNDNCDESSTIEQVDMMVQLGELIDENNNHRLLMDTEEEKKSF